MRATERARRRRRVAVRAVATMTMCAALAATGCSTDDRGATTSAPARPGTVRLTATGADVDQPVHLVTAPGGRAVLVAERGGRVLAFTVAGTRLTGRRTVLDVRAEVGDTSGEKGLLGLAVAPDGRRLFLSATRAADGASVVTSYPLSGTDARPTVDRAGRRELLVVEQPFANHNGGHVAFGPDRRLYLGLGDGGAAGDPDGNGQDLTTPLGKVLRLDTSGEPPADNPFNGRDDADPRIWLRGVRNPWRFSFDPATGDLWIGDVGQDAVEEVDVLRASAGGGRGANLGWDVREGDRPFADADPADDPGSLTDPVHTYTHDDGCSVTGGVVYRGTDVPSLRGRYLFADFCRPGLRSVTTGGGSGPRPSEPVAGTAGAQSVVSFGVGPGGEVYVVSLDDGILRLTR